KEQQLPYTVHVVTRLDKDTSGALLIAKHQYSHSLLTRQQRANEIERSYVAIVHGKMDSLKGTIDAPIGRSQDSIIERVVTEKGQEAITHYEVEEQTEISSLLRVQLQTGRTHQIRVHFAHLGHPLLGDDLYGGEKKQLN